MPNSRAKGKNAELELCRILGEKLGIKIERNLSQTRDGGYDLIGLEGFAPEIKRCERLCIPAWWRQTLEQAGNLQPVLFYRQSRKPWTVMVMNGGEIPTTINLDEFCEVVKNDNPE